MSIPSEGGNDGTKPQDLDSAGATVIAAMIGVVGSRWNVVQQSRASERTFSGVVKEEGGFPISGATIQTTIDQSIPHATRSDSDGVFHVQVPAAADSLHLSIYKQGFDVREQDANPLRTGPELLYLHKPQAREPRMPVTPPAKAKGHSSETKPPVEPVAIPHQFVPIEVGGSNIIGVNNGTATVNNNFGPRPVPDRVVPPERYFQAKKILERVNAKALTISLLFELTVSEDRQRLTHSRVKSSICL